MINQGYSYKVINRINLAGENLYYGSRDEQQDLLQKVLAANESAADEEDAVGGPGGLRQSGSSSVFRTQGTLSTLSGADEGLYMEIQRNKANKDKIRHPLFKKFYYSNKK